MIPQTKTVDEYRAHVPEDKLPMFDHLRNVLIDMGFDEQIKWRMPVYSAHGRNAVWLGVFKPAVSLSFFEGNRVDDYLSVLINAQEGKTEAMRHWRFSSLKDIDDDHVRSYLSQSIDISANPIKKVRVKKEVIIPAELKEVLDSDTTLQSAFLQMTPFQQREFCEYVATAKREKTKHDRVNKITSMILRGEGLNDKYRK